MMRLLTEVTSRKPQPGSCVTCISMHPTEPLVAFGLSSGELCLCASSSDGLTALLEYEEGAAHRSRAGTTSTSAAAAAAPPPPDPAKVLRIDSEGYALRHCMFVSGREDDITRELLHPLMGTSGGGSSSTDASVTGSRKTMARHLILCLTESGVYLLDVESGALLLHWDFSSSRSGGGVSGGRVIHRSSPFAPHRSIAHAVNYGALLFLAVADRASGVVERHVYVCHLALTDPFQAATATPRIQARAAAAAAHKATGPYVITLRHRYPTVTHTQERRLLKRQTGVRFLRVHPLAPLLMVGTAECVFVFADFTGNGEKLQPSAVVSTRESLRGVTRGLSTSSSSSSSVSDSASPLTSTALAEDGGILDACILTTDVVLRRGRPAVVENVQVALLTRHRISVLDLTHAADGVLDEQAFATPLTRPPPPTHHVSETGGGAGGSGGGGRASVDPTSSRDRDHHPVERTVPVCFTRLHAWMGSPGTLLVTQSDGAVLELSTGEVTAPLTRVLTVRSRMRAPHMPAAAVVQPSRRRSSAAQGTAEARSTPVLPLWGLLDVFATDPHTLRSNPSINACGERRVVFSSATGRAQVYAAAVTGSGGGARDGEADALVTSILATTDTKDCSAISFTALCTPVGGGETTRPHGLPVGTLLLDAPARLLSMEHGYYTVRGGRAATEEVYMVASLLYTTEADGLDGLSAPWEGPRPVVQAALLSLPARGRRPGTMRVAHLTPPDPPATTHAQSGGGGNGNGNDEGEQAGGSPQPAAAPATMELLSMSAVLGNDEVVPGVWALWAARGLVTSPGPGSAPLLTFHGFLLSAETGEVVWHHRGRPEVVRITDPLYQSPSQVFALSAVGGARGTGGRLEPPAAAVAAQLFLYYEESQVLALGTVVRGSPYVTSAASSFHPHGGGGGGDGDGEGELHYEPQAVLSISAWSGRGGKDGGGGRSFPHAIRLAATRAPGGDTLLVAIACRQHGLVIMQFPILAQAAVAGAAGGGASTLTREKILCVRHWAETEVVWTGLPPAGDTAAPSGDDGGAHAQGVGPRGGRPTTDAPPFPPPREDAPVHLLEWVFLATRGGEVAGAESRGRRCEDEDRSEACPPSPLAPAGGGQGQGPPLLRSPALAQDRQPPHTRATVEETILASFDDGAVPFLVLQRRRRIYVVHLSGTMVPLCPAIVGSTPIGVGYRVPRATTTVENTGEGHHDHGGQGSGRRRSSSGTAEEVEGTARARVQRQSDPASSRMPDETGEAAARRGRTSSLSHSTSAAGVGSAAVLRVHLLYGNYLGGLSRILRRRQARQQATLFTNAAAVALREARTNTPASPYWLLGAGRGSTGKRKGSDRHRTSVTDRLREAGDGEARSGGAARSGKRTPWEHVAARARLQSQQAMQVGLLRGRDRASAGGISNATDEVDEQWVGEASDPASSSPGAIVQMDVTEPLSTAVLKMQGMIAVRAITDLVTSSTLLSQFIRDTFRGFARHVQTAVIFGNLQTAEIIAAVPLASVTYCLSHEARLLVAQQRCQFSREKGSGLRGSTRGQPQSTCTSANSTPRRDVSTAELIAAQRARKNWWMLVMRSYTFVCALHPTEHEESLTAVQQTRQLAPEPYDPVKGDSSSCAYTAEVVAELLLYCPWSEHPPQLWAAWPAATGDAGEHELPAAGSDVPCGPRLLVRAVLAALTLLGASEAMAMGAEQRLAAHVSTIASGAGEASPGVFATCLRDVIASLPVGGEHWQSAVLYCNLVENLREIAGGEAALETTPFPPTATSTAGDQRVGNSESEGDTSGSTGTRAHAVCARSRTAALLADALACEGDHLTAMYCIRDVAASTVATLAGVPYRSPPGEGGGGHGARRSLTGREGDEGLTAAEKSLAEAAESTTSWDELRKRRMDTVVARSASARVRVQAGSVPDEDADAAAQTRKQQQQQIVANGIAAAKGSLGTLDDYFERGNGPRARLDELRDGVYASHWRALFDAAAYPSCYLFPSASAGGEYPLTQLPWQVWPETPTAARVGAAATTGSTAWSKADVSDTPPTSTQTPAASTGWAPPVPPPPLHTAAVATGQSPAVSVSRRVTPLEQQVAHVRETYTFDEADEAYGADGAAAAAAAVALGVGVEAPAQDAVARSLEAPDYRFTGDSAVRRSRAEEAHPQRSLDDGDYMNRFAKDPVDDTSAHL